MSVAFVVIPAVTAAGWPAIAAAVSAACSLLGFTAAAAANQVKTEPRELTRMETVELEMANAGVIGEALAREQEYAVEREGVRAVFTKDARGALRLHVSGERSHQELAAIGQELLGRVRQQFAYEKVKQELQSRGFVVVEEHVDENDSIRISVRRFQ